MTAMNVSAMKCELTDAPSATVTDWDSIVWPTVEQYVTRLQRRIAKATREENKSKVKFSMDFFRKRKAGWPDQFNLWSLEGLSRMRLKSHVRFLGE